MSRVSATCLAFACVVAACSSPSPGSEAAAPADLTVDQLPIRITTPIAGTFDQLVDHDGASPQPTFKQRFWYTTEFSRGPDSPTILYLCGEQTCGPSFLTRMADTAKVLHASIVTVEHRYYGESFPFPRPLTSADQLKYLSIHNALEDLATFEAYAKTSLGMSGKWLVAGGSYAGMLAAFYRSKHPELVAGAWSSSAPVAVQEEFWGYDEVAARALGPTCTLLFQQALDAAGRAFDDPAKLAAVSTAIMGQPWDPQFGSKQDFLNSISGSIGGEVQYGSTQKVCAALEQHAMSPLDGVMGYYAPPLSGDDDDDAGTPAAPASPASPATPSDRERVVDVGPGGFDSLRFRHPRPDDPPPAQDFGWAAWFYQTCTEVGFFFQSNPDRTQSIMPPGIDDTADLASCQQVFQSRPDIAKTRATYYEPLLAGQGTNIFYVNGTFDPWSSLSFDDPASPPPGATVFVIAQGSHHSELVSLDRDSPLGVFEAHAKFIELARGWLAQ
jgi:hypothetical protein